MDYDTDFGEGYNMNTTATLESMIPTTLLGIPTYTFLLIIGVSIVAWFLTKRVEHFSSARALVSETDYIQDIRNTAAFVGPYIGEIYLYLRAKYSQDKVPMFVPGSINDPTLADPLLPIARMQIKSWIDSNYLRMKNKYGEELMNDFGKSWNLTYTENANGVIEVSYLQKGQKSLYIV